MVIVPTGCLAAPMEGGGISGKQAPSCPECAPPGSPTAPPPHGAGGAQPAGPVAPTRGGDAPGTPRTPGIIHTIKQNCRRCYTCVRDCPAKAIRILDGQASVIDERCIGCGTCTAVCSQDAKAYVSGLERTRELLAGPEPVVALLAPSFPADFPDLSAGQLVAALEELGFEQVVEVAVGADLVGDAYRELLEREPHSWHIATACPAVAEYVRRYNPELCDRLVPVVSPMVATARLVRALRPQETLRCVFLGPCVAKKLEARDPLLPGEVDEVLTFQELGRLFAQQGIDPEDCPPRPFALDLAGMGRAFPLVGGLMNSAGLERRLLNSHAMGLSGQQETTDVLRNLRPSDEEPLLIEAMMCRGCYSGPGMMRRDQRQQRKQRVIEYVLGREHEARAPESLSPEQLAALHLDLSRRYEPDDQRLKEPNEREIKVILARTNKFSKEDELNCGSCGYPSCRDKAVAVYRGLAEDAMCLPFMIDQAERVCHELKVPWRELGEVHRHLINTEKLASLGQMAAGVAHELNNPLGTILLYTHLLGRKLADRDDLRHDLKLLVDESQRCKRIIGMLLDFARQNRVQFAHVSLAEVLTQAADEVVLPPAPPGEAPPLTILRSVDPPELDMDLDRDQMLQVLDNLLKNAVEAMEGRQGVVTLSARELPEGGRVRISVRDQGSGIPPEAQNQIFQPFFTTKSIGKGTGLGLPICYGIVKMHRGSIWFETEPGEGTVFHIDLPRAQSLTTRSIIDGNAANHPAR